MKFSMERQSDICSGIADISNLISDISKYLERSESIFIYQKLFRDIRIWKSDMKNAFKISVNHL